MNQKLDILNYLEERVCEALRVRSDDRYNCALEIDIIVEEHNSVIPVTINPIWMLDYILASTIVDVFMENKESFLNLEKDDKNKFIDAIEGSFDDLAADYNLFLAKVSESKLFDMDEVHLKFEGELKGAMDILKVNVQ